MIESVFLHQLKRANGVKILPDYILFRKPCELWNMKTGESVVFKNINEAFNFKINGKSIREIVADATTDIFYVQLDGGNGASGPKKTFKPDHADKNKKPAKRIPDYPARMNNKIKTKNVDTAIQEFRNKHQNSGTEHMIMVDKNGFVSQYNHGGKHSVGWMDNAKDGMVIHNHPSGGHFSDTDMLNLSHTQTRGVVATTKQGYYLLEKGTHFKANEWTKAVNGAKMTGTDYNDAMDRWLNKNAKKYGVIYKNVKVEVAAPKTTKATKAKSIKTTAPKAKQVANTPAIKFDKTGQGMLF